MLHPNEIKLDSAKSTLLLQLNKDDFKDQLEVLRNEAAKKSLQEKTEFHITAIGFTVGKIIQEHLKSVSKEDRTYLEDELRELIRETDWNFSMKNSKAFFITKEYANHKSPDIKETRYSIILMVELPALNGFYASLNELMGTSFEIPPAHITLFVGGTNPEKSSMGIGIDSRDFLEQLEPEELK